MSSRFLLAAALLAALPAVAAPPAAQAPPKGPPQQLPLTARWCLPASAASGAPRCILLEQALTPREQTLGLQLRPPLPPLRGMWFPFRQPQHAFFWMHRTPAALDMLFVRDGRVQHIVPRAQPCPRLPCPAFGPSDELPVEGVLELAAGQAEALGIRTGQPVRIELLPTPQAPALRPAGR
jgi:hypothetical protein